jgi:muconolactone delta-isomerase
VYTLDLLVSGSYTLQVSKQGYLPHTQTIGINQGDNVFNLIMQTDENKPVLFSENNVDELLQVAIQEARDEGTLGGELYFTDENPQIFAYREISILLLEQTTSRIAIQVDSNQDNAAFFLIRLDSTAVADITNLEVIYDNQTLSMGNIETIFNLQGETPSYAILLTEDKNGDQVASVLVYVPHFSAHTITISSLVETINGLMVFLVYLAFAAIAGVIFLTKIFTHPVYMNYFQKKRKR